MKKQNVTFFCAVLLALVLHIARAQAAPVEIDIFGPGQNLTYVAMSEPVTDAGAPLPAMAPELHRLIRHNLGFLPFLDFVDGKTVIGGNTPQAYKAPGIDFRRYLLAGTDLLIVTGWPQTQQGQSSRVELRVYETGQGSMLLGKAYYVTSESLLPVVADKFCSDFMKMLTGRGDFFLSTLAFVSQSRNGQKDIWAVRPTGRDLRQLTAVQGIALSPSWSPDGRYVIFSHIGERSHALGVWDRINNRTQLIRFPGNTVIGPTFLPDNRVAVSLAVNGNPDIFLLNHIFKKQKVLEQSWGIDVSPSLDATGKKMAFVSSRLGNPNIFLKDLDSGSVRRISREGKYNTSPDISPDGTLIVYSRRTGDGHRIFVHDLVTGREKQITFGPGNDEMPSFAPDSYFIAFASNRSGKYKVYLTTRHGGTPKMVDTGSHDASFPAWGKLSD
ncbi:Tol-Pal system beta propeller repeat protein TolB [Oleidesulfovibrio alaskensis G20]|uniref:Tol-Pal system beta propeller repeat protein TolB n=1 Tax=Oleidesulfovibrio alaskensis (strain ATCC BAA-1058 / DSM 17464 / G20) TaxID=207559 RepID=Q30V71_OLEA2|nr:PD40 domain-containing protein [Oleidesulfovibrio alaskensis]ABB40425.1 Tol-Pal system beta propeller repeat protein TolB [Oleidesulfovibrio alaskensis G20]MBG0772689.1 PD40 domain-containing protein [Oleidesulfovibrio alaskensis]